MTDPAAGDNPAQRDSATAPPRGIVAWVLRIARGERWWLAPLLLLICLGGLALLLLQNIQYIAPFVYSSL